MTLSAWSYSTMLLQLLWSDVQCYWKHMELDPDTGTQPSNISMTVVRCALAKFFATSLGDASTTCCLTVVSTA